jgi:hypothetical protein
VSLVSPKGEVAGSRRASDELRWAEVASAAPTNASRPPAALTLTASRVGERALSLGWTGQADTDFDARRLSGDHTLSVRFMAAYEAAYRGVLLADRSGSYRVGLAPYSTLDRPAIEVVVGGTAFTYPLADPVLTDNDFRNGVPQQPLRRWRQLVVRVRGREVSVLLDGSEVGAFRSEARAPTGSLRFGRLARPDAMQDQFYGFIDDVALFERALSAHELQALARLPTLDVGAPALLAAWLFNDTEGRIESKEMPFRLRGAAEVSAVSLDRDNANDSARLPRPRHKSAFSLPFAAGQVWLLIQGVNSALSHNDSAAFALDFLRVDPSLTLHNPARLPGGSHAASEGAPFAATADGTVVARVDCFPNDNRGLCPTSARAPARSDVAKLAVERAGQHGDGEGNARERRATPGDPANRNLLCLEHDAGEVSCTLHLEHGSARFALGARAERGSELGAVGKTGANRVHLHFAVSDRAEPNEPGTFAPLVTFPVAFSDYDVSSDFGASWQHVAKGVPLPGQWLRRAHVARPH